MDTCPGKVRAVVELSYFHQKILGDVLSIYRSILQRVFNNNLLQYLGNKIWKESTTSEILDKWSSYPEFFSASRASESYRLYLFFRTVILQKKSRRVPMSVSSRFFQTIERSIVNANSLERLPLDFREIAFYRPPFTEYITSCCSV